MRTIELSVILSLFIAVHTTTIYGQHAAHQHDMTVSPAVHTVDGSGTSMLPGSTPENMMMYHFDNASMMVHGSIFSRYMYIHSKRVGSEFSTPNWIMGDYTYTFDESHLMRIRSMMSFDVLTDGSRGYPLLLQSGEGLVDRQHPHDLFSEISITYKYRVSNNTMLELYAGLPGEPSIGPPVFMHRSSALSNPDAPLGHHLQDATHITYGVVTMGMLFKSLKVELSAFNGSEPDEDRYGIETPKLNSYSSRITYNPTNELSVQTSAAYLTDPEHRGVNARRLTSSLLYTTIFSKDRWFAASAVFGMNREDKEDALLSVLLEGSLYHGKSNIYSRYEFVQRTDHDLQIERADQSHTIYDTHTISVGYSYNILSLASIDLSTGIQAGYNFLPRSLSGLYGSTPYALQVYVSLKPSF